MKNYFIFDIESAGLNGSGFAFGYVVIDENGTEKEAKFATAGIDAIKEIKQDDRKWLEKNLPKEILYPEGEYKLNLEELRTAFRNAIEKHKNAIIVCDCGYPVETKWLLDCECEIYPLHEIATALLMRNKDPIGHFPRKDNEKPEHHPLADARQSARIWLECIKEIK